MRAWLVSLILAVSMLGSGASANENPEPGIDPVEIDKRAQSLMKTIDMVGLGVAIVEDGEIVFAKGYGERRARSGEPVTKDTVFRWASVSKSVGAAAVLGLIDKGVVDKDIPIQTLAPSLELPETDYQHDIVDLLSHRIGITSNAFDTRIEDGRDPDRVRSQLSELKYLCDPGTCHTYQNVTFDAATEIVERATGLPYKSIVQRDIFAPLGMTTASISREAMLGSDWAEPHSRSGRLINRLKPHYYRLPAAAGVNSSVEDLARWMIGQMPDTDSPLSETVREAMQTPLVRTIREQNYMNRRFGGLKSAHYGLGLRTYTYRGHKVVGHRGGVEGYRALILFDPEKRSGIAMMWNTSHSHPIGLQLEFLDQLYGLPKRDWMGLRRERRRQRLLELN